MWSSSPQAGSLRDSIRRSSGLGRADYAVEIPIRSIRPAGKAHRLPLTD
jgi:hypothetical protein